MTQKTPIEIRSWHPDMSDKEAKDLAYWERNMLALFFADGWYNDDVIVPADGVAIGLPEVYPTAEKGMIKVPRFEGWRRVLSLLNGQMCFHIPDDFETGNVPEINRNWDGHSTYDKWAAVCRQKRILYISLPPLPYQAEPIKDVPL